MTAFSGSDGTRLAELAPVLRRAVRLDPRTLARVRLSDIAGSVLVRLPFGVLVSRTVAERRAARPVDVTVRAADLLAWLDGEAADPPKARDAEWRTGLPPPSGWSRVERVPEDVVRRLVRSGARALKEAAAREGLTGAQPRAEVADALLDAAVLTASDDAGRTAEVTLRALSALIWMGFLPRGGQVHVDVAGRWVRVAAEYGSVFLEGPGGLTLR